MTKLISLFLLLSEFCYANPKQLHSCAMSLKVAGGPGYYSSWPLEEGSIFLPGESGQMYIFRENTDQICQFDTAEKGNTIHSLIYSQQGKDYYLTLFDYNKKIDCCTTEPDKTINGVKFLKWRVGSLYHKLECQNHRDKKTHAQLISMLKERLKSLSDLIVEDHQYTKSQKSNGRAFDENFYHNILNSCREIDELKSDIDKVENQLQRLNPPETELMVDFPEEQDTLN